jgi:hypothetical protein
LASEESEANVIEAGEKFELLSTNLVGEITIATLAISENVLY